ncbi:MAG: class I SAM-dependent methyltransferase [Luteimonas sp.]
MRSLRAYTDALLTRLALRKVQQRYRLPFPPGHFYSPVTDVDDLAAQRATLWHEPAQTPGIDYNDAGHEQLLRDVFPPLLVEFDYPADGGDDASLTTYYTGNSQFPALDAKVLFAMLRHVRPRRMIEVGSGYSTLLTADINCRFFGGSLELTCIEPYPRAFLTPQLPGLHALRVEPVQHTPPDVFDTLQAGDVLFIDSSHVLKTGSDLTFLATRVLPRLASGVLVHMHDIFLPDDYPPAWVLDENRAWNEQYLLQAMLAHSSRYCVVFGSNRACLQFPALVAATFGLAPSTRYAGGSFWFEVQ